MCSCLLRLDSDPRPSSPVCKPGTDSRRQRSTHKNALVRRHRLSSSAACMCPRATAASTASGRRYRHRGHARPSRSCSMWVVVAVYFIPNPHAQEEFRARFDWGLVGTKVLAGTSDVVAVVRRVVLHHRADRRGRQGDRGSSPSARGTNGQSGSRRNATPCSRSAGRWPSRDRSVCPPRPSAPLVLSRSSSCRRRTARPSCMRSPRPA
jgi:hypothetical protein